MQVDPVKPTLKAPGPERLRLDFDRLLSNFAFGFNLRRYTVAQLQSADWKQRLEGITAVAEVGPASAYSVG